MSMPNNDDETETYMTVGDLKKHLQNYPDDMEVMAVVKLPEFEDDDEDGEGSDEDENVDYIPISGFTDVKDEETGDKMLGFFVDLKSHIEDADDDEDDDEPVDDENDED